MMRYILFGDMCAACIVSRVIWLLWAVWLIVYANMLRKMD